MAYTIRRPGGSWVTRLLVVLLVLPGGVQAAEKMGFSNFGWSADIRSGVKFDSNYSRAPVPDPGVIFKAKPGVELGWHRGRNKWDARATYEWQRSITDMVLDRHTIDTATDLDIRTSTGLHTVLGYGFVDTDELNELDRVGNELIERYRHSGRLLLGQATGSGRFDMELDYQIFQDRYRQKFMKEFSRITHNIALNGFFQLFPKTAVYARLGSQAIVPSYPDLEAVSRKSQSVSLMAGIKTRWARKISLQLETGGIAWFFRDFTQWAPVVNMDFVYHKDALTELTLSGGYQLNDSTVGLYLKLARAQLAAERMLARSLRGTGDITYANIVYVADKGRDRVDNLVKSHVGLVYNPVPFQALEVLLQYGFERRISNSDDFDLVEGGLVNATFRAHLANIEVSLRL